MSIFRKIIKKYNNKPCPICNSLVSGEAFCDGISCKNYHRIRKYTCFNVDTDAIQMLFGNILIVVGREMGGLLKIANVGGLDGDIILLNLKINVSELEPTFPFINKIISEDKIKTLELFQ